MALTTLYIGNNLPSALNGERRAKLGISTSVQTALYATAVAVILLCLVLAGPLSDTIGRRAPILVGLGAFVVGDVVFLRVREVTLLFVARAVQGFGMGIATAAAQATLSDTARGDPPAARRRASMTATACMTFGLALGPLLGGVPAEYGSLRLGVAVHAVVVDMIPAVRVGLEQAVAWAAKLCTLACLVVLPWMAWEGRRHSAVPAANEP
ncbi:MFS transporter [Pseudonocardia lutea]|uniref:MFS transporter n=1 Tax=Pseudonocardia lutea TaxID=2172015 RepID=A0ABW1IFT1_9PSEU